MTDEPSPRPWRLKQSPIGSNTWIVSGALLVASASRPADAALIVEAVNWYCDWGALSAELQRLRAERDRLRDELADKAQNYEDVIAHHQRTEEYLRGLIKRLITVREKVFWRKDEKTGMTYESCLMDEEEARKTVEEAKAAIGEDAK